jgi:hypothetical protein
MNMDLQEIMAETLQALGDGITEQYSIAEVIQAIQQADAEAMKAMQIPNWNMSSSPVGLSTARAADILIQTGVYGSASIAPSMPNTIVGYSPEDGVWFGSPPHPWLTKNGLAFHMRIMRGEEKLPHMPTDCQHCRDMYVAQKEALKANGAYRGLFGRKSNPGRRRMAVRVALVQTRLRTLS